MASQNSPAPLICTLSTDELSQRREEIIQALFKRGLDTRERNQGLEFTFPAEETLLSDLLEFIRFERNCCRFLSFEIVFEPEQGPLRLRILGAPEAKPLIREMFLLHIT
jgi:hypothetical protein